MKILAGFLLPDDGEIRMESQPVHFSAPRDALAAGIGMVHQHFRLVNNFTVAENLALGDPGVPRLLDRVALDANVREWSERFQLALDPDARVWQLSIGEQQRVEVLRALARGASVLILDEPTSVLTPQESEKLCQTLRDMAASGRIIVFISHKLNEALMVADEITVMRHGKRLETLDRSECNPQMLARLMVGESTDAVRRADANYARGAEPVIELRDATLRDRRGVYALRSVNLTVRAGEVLGIAGVAGNGQAELAALATGTSRPDSGSVILNGIELAKQGSGAFTRQGLGYIPEDRRGTGLVPSQPIWRNAILKQYRKPPVARGVLVRTGPAKRLAQKLAAHVHLSTGKVDTPVEHLSGGNAQKLLAGRELAGDPTAVVAVNPTQGLDVTAEAEVSRGLLEARGRGGAVLLISQDLDELLRLSDRIAVMYEGQIAGEFAAEDADREHIGLLMGGLRPPDRDA
jgi:simple sugar transport system ATP-binding protein